jgi:hypothetical protein
MLETAFGLLDGLRPFGGALLEERQDRFAINLSHSVNQSFAQRYTELPARQLM